MSGKTHNYKTKVEWTGNRGTGTSGYRDYDRNHTIAIEGKPDIAGSSDPSFRGDPNRHNPEEFLVASLSTCHMLTYLHLCAVNKVVVTRYEDDATGQMEETANGGGRFTEVVLHPRVWVSDASMMEKANDLHHQAHELCFIAASVNFPVKHEPESLVE